jgi:16S rRNA (cytidine1402-2'-O)-methyltransferase
LGRLTVVATPIGNLGDITPRAVEALASADLVLAEDTRRTRSLLTHLEIRNKDLERLDAHAEAKNLDAVLARLEGGASVVLVSDAGTPAISDPGARLVQVAAAAGHEVTSLPGASAVTTAIAASGFGGSRFRFFGFLPRKGSALAATIEDIADTPEVVVYFESAPRMASSLRLLAERLGSRDAVVAREISKKHEELIRGPLDALAQSERDRAWRGEITVVIGPRPASVVSRLSVAELDLRIHAEVANNDRPRTIAKRLAADTGWSSREIYQRIVAHKEGSE